MGLEGVIAKQRSSRYHPGDRGWIKVKNPNYWRPDFRAWSHAALCRTSVSLRTKPVDARFPS